MFLRSCSSCPKLVCSSPKRDLKISIVFLTSSLDCPNLDRVFSIEVRAFFPPAVPSAFDTPPTALATLENLVRSLFSCWPFLLPSPPVRLPSLFWNTSSSCLRTLCCCCPPPCTADNCFFISSSRIPLGPDMAFEPMIWGIPLPPLKSLICCNRSAIWLSPVEAPKLLAMFFISSILFTTVPPGP